MSKAVISDPFGVDINCHFGVEIFIRDKFKPRFWISCARKHIYGNNIQMEQDKFLLEISKKVIYRRFGYFVRPSMIYHATL